MRIKQTFFSLSKFLILLRDQFNKKKYENNFFLEKNATRVKTEKQLKEVISSCVAV
jgi:hypothetical protein